MIKTRPRTVKTMNKAVKSESEAKAEAIASALDSFYQLPRPATKRGLLCGTRAIGTYLFDADDRAAVRATYHILETTNSIPAYKHSGMWYARIASINAKIWTQEKQAWTTEDEETLARLHIVLATLLSSLVAIETAAPTVDSRTTTEFVAEAVKIIGRLLRPRKP
jgi:hypothetical protein